MRSQVRNLFISRSSVWRELHIIIWSSVDGSGFEAAWSVSWEPIEEGGPFKKVLVPFDNPESIGAAHRGRSRQFPPARKFAERPQFDSSVLTSSENAAPGWPPLR